jgi:Ca2+:H+ antiporter
MASMLKDFFAPQNILNWLLLLVPVAIALMHASPIAVFISSALAIVPLAGWMGRATEHLAEKLGEGIGGIASGG